MKKALIGAGGHASEVLAHLGCELPCFVDKKYNTHAKPLLNLEDFDPREFEVMIAVGDPFARKQIAERLPHETVFFSFIHPTAIVVDAFHLQNKGAFVGAYSFISKNVKTGMHALFNRGVQIGHDCRFGEYVTVMPGAIVSGNVTVGDCAFFGSAAIVRENVRICSDVKFGLNCGVVSDVSEPGVYVGTPARMLHHKQG